MRNPAPLQPRLGPRGNERRPSRFRIGPPRQGGPVSGGRLGAETQTSLRPRRNASAGLKRCRAGLSVATRSRGPRGPRLLLLIRQPDRFLLVRRVRVLPFGLASAGELLRRGLRARRLLVLIGAPARGPRSGLFRPPSARLLLRALPLVIVRPLMARLLPIRALAVRPLVVRTLAVMSLPVRPPVVRALIVRAAAPVALLRRALVDPALRRPAGRLAISARSDDHARRYLRAALPAPARPAAIVIGITPGKHHRQERTEADPAQVATRKWIHHFPQTQGKTGHHPTRAFWPTYRYNAQKASWLPSSGHRFSITPP